MGTAFAFAGASSVTNLVTKAILGDVRGKFKRHNLEMEQITRERDNIVNQQRLDYENKIRRDQNHAEQTFSDLDDAMLRYYEVTGAPLKDPQKDNPSRQEKDAGIAVTMGLMLVVGVFWYKYYK